MRMNIEDIFGIEIHDNDDGQILVIRWKDSDLIHVYDVEFIGEYRLRNISELKDLWT